MNDKPGGMTPYIPYNLALGLLSPVLLPYAAAKDLGRIGPDSMRDRWGRPHLTTMKDGPRIWVHAASVGETMVAASILRELRGLLPRAQIVFSNITATGHDTALRIIPDVQHIYFPFDFPLAVRRALGAIRPELCVMVETELWPNFIHLSRRAGARTVLVNGRLSDRTFRRASRPLARGLFRWMLAGMDRLGFQTDADAERAISLGAPADRVEVAGNTKFDQALVDDPPASEVAREMDFAAGKPTLVAGSTHIGEDEAVLDAFQKVRDVVPAARLIIAPRRLERVPGLRESLERRRLTARYRSRQSGPGAENDSAGPTDGAGRETDRADVLVLDTIGELRRVYALARVAFVGGTLVPVGGHDLLQPLAKRVPVLFGPYTHNCREIATTVLEAGAGRRIADSAELAREWIRLLNAPAEANAAGQKGLDLLLQNQGASNRYAGMIAALVGH